MKHQYIDNKMFLQALIDYKASVKEAKDTNIPIPRMPEYLGKCFLDISENMSRRPEFINYSYKQEMISDGYLVCVKYWYAFNAEVHDNPFGYFSRSVYRAFIARITREKKEQYSRYKLTFNSGIFDSGNLTDSNGNAINESEGLADNMYEFIRQYEQKAKDKKDRKVVAAKKDVVKRKASK